jgi:hypothetical protein
MLLNKLQQYNVKLQLAIVFDDMNNNFLGNR